MLFYSILLPFKEEIMIKQFLLILVILLLVIPVNADKLMRLAIVEFQTGTGISKGLAKDISELLYTELVNTGYFTVIERSQMKSVLKEHEFQLTGIMGDTKDAVEFGKLLQANKILTGRVTKIGKTYLINARIIDIEKGEVEFAEKVESPSKDGLIKQTSALVKKLSERILGISEEESEGVLPSLDAEGKEYEVDISLKKELKKKDRINCIQVNKAEDKLAIGFVNGKVEIYSLDIMKLVKTVDLGMEIKALYFVKKYLYASGSDKNIKRYNMDSGKIKKILTKHNNTVNCMAFTSDNKLFVSGSEDWSINAFKKKRYFMKIEDNKNAVNALKFTSNDEYLISVDNNKSVIFWRLPIFKKLKEIKMAHKDRIVSLDISPDDKQFITGSYDSKIKLWQRKSYKLIGEYTEHKDTVSALKFYDNDLFFSGSFDGTIKLWRLRGFREVTFDSNYFLVESVDANMGYIKDLIISHKNKFLIGCGNKSVKIWNLKITVEEE